MASRFVDTSERLLWAPQALARDEVTSVSVARLTGGINAVDQLLDLAEFEAGALGDPGETEVVEFSPTEELGRTMEIVTKNMEKMGAAFS